MYARKKLKVPTVPAVSCKRTDSRHRVTVARMMIPNQKLRASMEVEEFKRLRMEGTLPKIQEDHTAGKRSNSLQYFNLVHAAKEVMDKDWQKLEKISTWNLECDSTFLHHWWISVIWRMLNYRRNIRKTKVELYSEEKSWKTIQTPIHRVTIISITNDSCKSHGYHFPGWVGQAAETVSAHTQN